MSPAIVKEPMILRKGVRHTSTITLTTSGSAMDLTGRKVTANLHAGTPANPGAVVYTISTDNGYLTVDAPLTGVINIDLPGSVIATYVTGDYVMNVFVLTSGDVVIANGHPLIRFVQVLPSGVSTS